MFFVKITTQVNNLVFVEYAGSRGVRSLEALQDTDGFYVDGGKIVKKRKLEGWKTRTSAERYIKAEQECDVYRKWQRNYEIIQK